MATKKVNIDIIAKDKSKQALNRVQGNLSGLKRSVFNLRNAFITLGAGAVIKSIVNTGKEIENLQVRLKFLFGTAEEGAKAFDEMAKFASKVPFSLAEIQQGAGVLAVVSKDANELKKVMELTGNVAAVTGLDFKTTAEQIQRSLSAGIGAADLFRDRGVKSMLGFKAGAKVSIEETAEAFDRVFGSGGQFDGATDELAQTFEGTLSMIGDKIFNFKRTILEAGFFPELKKQFEELDNFLANESEALDEIAKTIGESLAKAMRTLADVVIIVKDNFELLKIAAGAFIAFKLTGVIIAITGALVGMYRQLVGITALSGPRGLALIVASMVAMELATRNFKKEVIDARKELKKLTLSELIKKSGELELQILKLNQAQEELKLKMEKVSEGAGKMDGHFDFLNDTLAQVPENLQLLANEYDDNTRTINNLNHELAILNNMLTMGEGKTGRLIEVYGALDNDLKDFIKTSKKVTEEVVKLIEVNGVLDGDFRSLHPTLTATKEALDSLRDAYFGVSDAANNVSITTGNARPDEQFGMSKHDKKALEDKKAHEEEINRILEENRIKGVQIFHEMEAEKERINNETKIKEINDAIAHAKKLEEIQKNNFHKMLDEAQANESAKRKMKEEASKHIITDARSTIEILAGMNEKAFRVFKAIQIAEATINAFKAASTAFKAYAGIFPANIGVAAMALAKGMAMVAKIQATSYSGRQQGGMVKQGQPYMVGEAGKEMFVPSQNGKIVPNHDLQQGVNVNFNINTVDARGFNELLVNSRGVIVNMINNAVNEKGRQAII